MLTTTHLPLDPSIVFLDTKQVKKKPASTLSITSNYPRLITPAGKQVVQNPSAKVKFTQTIEAPVTITQPKNDDSKSNRKLAYLALLANAIIWGAALPIVKPSLEFIAPNQFLWLRYLLAAPLMLPICFLAFKRLQIQRKHLPYIILTEIVTVISLVLIYLGLDRTTSLEASLLLSTRPILVTIAGVLLLHEVEEKHEWLGLILSIIGTTVILVAPLLNGKGHGFTTESLIGNGIILISNLLNMVNVVMIKRWYNGLPKLAITSIGTLIGFVFMSVLMLFSGLPNLSSIAQPSVLTAVLYMGLPGTILAFSLLNYGYSAIETSEASLFSYLQPLVYIPLAIIWLHEPFDLSQFVGIGIMLAGVAIAEYRPGKKGIFAKTQKLQHHHH